MYMAENQKKITAVDLFCGTGGLTHGLSKSGISVVAGYDLAADVKFAYEKNNSTAKFFEKSVEDISTAEIRDFYHTEFSLLAGCAPCQPFSQMNNGKLLKMKDWGLLYHFSRLVKYTLPTFVTMENVTQIKQHQVYHDFINELESLGYSISENIVFCPDYGIPQRRRRLVVLASRLGEIHLLPPTHDPENYRTVRDTIGNLPPLEAGQTDPNDPLHSASIVSEMNLLRLKHSKPNGSWKDWPKDLVAPCHRREDTKNYTSAYGRMAWDEPSPTITTGCHGISHGRFGHPEQDRALSLREAALLQSFPADYQFTPPDKQLSKGTIARMIGNAVPVDLGWAIGRSFINHLEAINVKI